MRGFWENIFSKEDWKKSGESMKIDIAEHDLENEIRKDDNWKASMDKVYKEFLILKGFWILSGMKVEAARLKLQEVKK